MPIIETEMAAAAKEGTSQTINWKLVPVELLNQIFFLNDLQNGEEGVYVDGVNGSDLVNRMDIRFRPGMKTI